MIKEWKRRKARGKERHEKELSGREIQLLIGSD
jgi:hypothetical protein